MKIIKARMSLFSDNPDNLANFYIDILNFKLIVKVDRHDDYGYGLEATVGYKLWIAKHSGVEGRNKDPFRIMLSFYVDDINEYFDKLKKSSMIKIVELPILACEGIKNEERLVGSFLDPDGNCVQLIQLLNK